MDLTKTFPRSPKAKIAGLVMFARTTDKARAHNAGTPGEYHYGCGMDRHVLSFLGTEPDAFAVKVAQLPDDSSIEAWALKQLGNKSAADIETFNAEFAIDGPEAGSEGEKFLFSERSRLHRPDVTSWFDLLDVDENREVPVRVAA